MFMKKQHNFNFRTSTTTYAPSVEKYRYQWQGGEPFSILKPEFVGHYGWKDRYIRDERPLGRKTSIGQHDHLSAVTDKEFDWFFGNLRSRLWQSRSQLREVNDSFGRRDGVTNLCPRTGTYVQYCQLPQYNWNFLFGVFSWMLALGTQLGSLVMRNFRPFLLSSSRATSYLGRAQSMVSVSNKQRATVRSNKLLKLSHVFFLESTSFYYEVHFTLTSKTN